MVKQAESVDPRVEEAMGAFASFLDKLDTTTRSMTEPMLRSFIRYSIDILDLENEIDRSGLIVDGPRGPVANPLNAVLHQYTQRRGDYYNKILKVFTAACPDDEDKLAAFLG